MKEFTSMPPPGDIEDIVDPLKSLEDLDISTILTVLPISITLKECGIEISKLPYTSEPLKKIVVSSPSEPKDMIDISVLKTVELMSEPGEDLAGIQPDLA